MTADMGSNGVTAHSGSDFLGGNVVAFPAKWKGVCETRTISMATAVHEAGRALGECRFGLGFRAIHAPSRAYWLDAPTPDRPAGEIWGLGLCEPVEDYEHDEPEDNLRRDGFAQSGPACEFTTSPLEITRRLTAKLCGMIAESSYASKSFRDVLLQAYGVTGLYRVAMMCKYKAESTDVLRQMCDMATTTARLFMADPVVWQAVLDLADILVARGSVTSSEVPEIIDRVVAS